MSQGDGGGQHGRDGGGATWAYESGGRGGQHGRMSQGAGGGNMGV